MCQTTFSLGPIAQYQRRLQEVKRNSPAQNLTKTEASNSLPDLTYDPWSPFSGGEEEELPASIEQQNIILLLALSSTIIL